MQLKVAEIAAQSMPPSFLARRSLATARKDMRTSRRRAHCCGATLPTPCACCAMSPDSLDSRSPIERSDGQQHRQRRWRDVHAISSHVVMNWDVPVENFGRAEFGMPRTRRIRCFKPRGSERNAARNGVRILMTKRHQGRTAVISGAASGIGEASAVRLAEEGARIVIADRDKADQTLNRSRASAARRPRSAAT